MGARMWTSLGRHYSAYYNNQLLSDDVWWGKALGTEKSLRGALLQVRMSKTCSRKNE